MADLFGRENATMLGRPLASMVWKTELEKGPSKASWKALLVPKLSAGGGGALASAPKHNLS